MRLTLRTVLAYLDDQLEPIQAREIGERIGESKEAAALVARTKEVIRRRRIGAPELTGPGSGPDPNLVSDYLENVLPPGQVLELERLCQASDLHLAEIAACHKILTMVLGQRIEVPQETRDRMYALGSRKAPTEVSKKEPAAQPMAEGIGAAAKSSESGLPDYLRDQRSSKVWSIALIVLIGVAWGALVVTDRSLWSRPTGLTDEQLAARPVELGNPNPAPMAPVPANATLPDRAAPGEPGPSVADANQPPAPDSNNVAQSTNNATNTINPPPPPDAPETSSNQPPQSIASTVGASPESMTKPDSTNSQPQAKPDAEVEEVPVAREAPMIYESGDGVLIHQGAKQRDWQTISHRSLVHVGDEFASPAPFQNTLVLNEQIELQLMPGTRLKRLASSDDVDLAFEFDRGQLMIVRPQSVNSEVSVSVTIGERSWVITLLEPGTQCGLELTLPEPEGPPGQMGELELTGGIAVGDGRIRIASESVEPLTMTADSGYAEWPKTGTELESLTDVAVPLWLLPEGNFVTPAARSLARLYQREFENDLAVVQSIGPVIKDRRASISELATQTMALIDRYSELVPALDAGNEEARIAAIKGLRKWLPRDLGNDALMVVELRRTFPEKLVDPITRLLWGYGPNEARNPDISERLITQMQDPQLVIRELAFYHVAKLTGRQFDYLPMAPLAERKAAISRWEDYIKRNGGALLPPAR